MTINDRVNETYITENDIRTSENTIFVFGDNLERKGLGGQAAIARQFVNDGKTIGIPTKRAPCEQEDCYFSDRNDEISAVRYAFSRIREARRSGKKIVFFPRIGEGYAQLRERSPYIYGMIQGFMVTTEKIDGDCDARRTTKTKI